MKKKKKDFSEEQVAEKLIKTLVEIKESPAPKDNNCPKCNTQLNYAYQLITPTPVSVKCPKCGWQEGWWAYIGKRLVTVDELPQAGYAKYEIGKPVFPTYKNKNKK
jgi:ssDNA-binding Zn-finger/Zn-ribbon topoisomerase 1